MNTKTQSPDGLVPKILNALGIPTVYLTVIALLLSLSIPLLFTSYIIHIFALVFITGIGAIGWNVIGGFGGQFSLGNAVFYGIGGYSTGILVTDYGVSVFIAVAVGILLAVIFSVIVGLPTFTLSGHYFALATIAVVEGMFFLADYFSGITGGSRGLTVQTPAWLASLMTNKTIVFYLFLTFFIIAVIVSIWVRYSRLGYYLLAIREDQDAAAALGVNTRRYKVYGFALSAVMAAFAGSMHAVYVAFLFPGASFSLDLSILYALIALIGGMGTISGPILGTFLMVPLQQYVTTSLGGSIGALSYVGYGALLIVMIIYAPEGIVNRLSFIPDKINETLPEVKFDAAN